MGHIARDHGWTAVPRSLEKLIASRRDPKLSAPSVVDDIPLPDNALVQQVMKYAKDNLPPETFNHSMRVYFFGSLKLISNDRGSANTAQAKQSRNNTFPSGAFLLKHCS